MNRNLQSTTNAVFNAWVSPSGKAGEESLKSVGSIPIRPGTAHLHRPLDAINPSKGYYKPLTKGKFYD